MDSNSLQFWDKLTTKGMWLSLATLGYLSVQKVYEYLLERKDDLEDSDAKVKIERKQFKLKLIERMLKAQTANNESPSPSKKGSLKKKLALFPPIEPQPVPIKTAKPTDEENLADKSSSNLEKLKTEADKGS